MDIEAWIAGARAGDAGAFNRLVDAFQGLCYHVALHHTGGDPELAEDACQEAMLSAWHAVGRFEGDARAFRAWLMRVVVNACRDVTRYERRRPHGPLEGLRDGEPWELPLPDHGQSPEAYALNADLAQLLAGVLARLATEHREVILLDQAGFSYAEIAAILDIAGGTVKSRLSRARVAARALLSGEGEPAASRRRSAAAVGPSGERGPRQP
jgi:RNA polymerase sigma factor (sigma-70 family)